jgi:hypothetical protein
MSTTEEIVGPKTKIGSYMEPVLDKPRIDRVVTKYFNAIWQYLVAVDRVGGPVDLVGNGFTFAELRNTVNAVGFVYGDLLALASGAEIGAMNAYLDLPEGDAFPANFPESMQWMNLLTIKEKKELTKSEWRTRNFHALVPGFLACYSIMLIFASGEMYAIMACKFRKVEAQVYADSKLQIPYNVLKPDTFLAQHYRANFPLDAIYLTIQLDMLIDHLYAVWDQYQFIIPEEAVKFGGMLFGQFKNFIMNSEGEIIYDYPVDLLFIGTLYDDNIFGDDFTNVIEPFLELVRDMVENLYAIAETVEYGDKFYSNTFSDFKALLTPVKMDTKLLTQFGPLPTPWPHIFLGWHYDDLQTRNEPIARAWDENANPGMDISDDSGNQAANFFIRQLEGKLLDPGVLDEDHPIQYIYALMPYGYEEEAWRKALAFGWAFLSQFMGGMDLNTDMEFGDTDTILSHFTYAEFYDSDDNLKNIQAVDDDVEIANDSLVGMFGLSDHPPFNDQFKLRLVNSRAYADLVYNELGTVIAGDDALTIASKFEADYFENIQKILGYIKNQQTEFDWQHTRDWFLKSINPRIAAPQQQSKEVSKQVETDKPEEENKPKKDEEPKKDLKTGKGDPTQPSGSPSGPPKLKESAQVPDSTVKSAELNLKQQETPHDIKKAPLQEIVDTHVQTGE